MTLQEQIDALPEWPERGPSKGYHAEVIHNSRMAQPALARLALARNALRWCLDNCDDSPEYNFGTDGADALRSVIAALEVPQ